MPTIVRLARHSPCYKIDDLVQDAELAAESRRLQAWLAQLDVELLTGGQAHAFVMQTQPLATLEKSVVWYEWIFDPPSGLWFQVCHERAAVVYPTEPGISPIELVIERSAKY